MILSPHLQNCQLKRRRRSPAENIVELLWLGESRDSSIFKGSDPVPSNGSQGGIALLWNNSVDIQIFKFSDNFITAKVQFQLYPVNYILNGLYGEPRSDKRLTFWAAFKNIHCLNNDP